MIEKNMKGKVCMITGSNSGIGKETALGLARLGAHLVMVCRNRESAEAALMEIKEQSGNEQLELMLCDLSSLKEVQSLADEFKRKHEKLDVLINNAGVVPWKRTLTEDGLELTLVVNHLAPFLLTHLLLDVLKASVPSRIINVASGLHKMASIDFDDLQSEKKFGGFHAYSEAKLAFLIFSYELAKRLEGTGVTVNALHPGVVRTNLSRHSPWYMRLGPLFFKNPAKGAETPIYLASSPDVEKVTGKYFINKKEGPSSDESYDQRTARRVWDISVQLVGLE